MPQSNPTPTKADPTALAGAFDALKTYDQGSSRGALVPIDEAVKAALDDKAAQKELEQRLVTHLKRVSSPVAAEYICSKLTLIGAETCVKELAMLLNRVEFATAARNALEAIPGRAATKALRDSLPKVVGLQKVGVINSLGARRDSDSVRTLTALLKHSDNEVVAAVATALGEIGTARAAKVLSALLPKAPPTLRAKLTYALLKCAEQLVTAGARINAEKIYGPLDMPGQPEHVRLAAALGIRRAAGRK